MLPEESRVLLIMPSEACAKLGVSISTLDRWVKEGRLECVRMSDGPRPRRRFTLGHLNDFIASKKAGGGMLG